MVCMISLRLQNVCHSRASCRRHAGLGLEKPALRTSPVPHARQAPGRPVYDAQGTDRRAILNPTSTSIRPISLSRVNSAHRISPPHTASQSYRHGPVRHHIACTFTAALRISTRHRRHRTCLIDENDNPSPIRGQTRAPATAPELGVVRSSDGLCVKPHPLDGPCDRFFGKRAFWRSVGFSSASVLRRRSTGVFPPATWTSAPGSRRRPAMD